MMAKDEEAAYCREGGTSRWEKLEKGTNLTDYASKRLARMAYRDSDGSYQEYLEFHLSWMNNADQRIYASADYNGYGIDEATDGAMTTFSWHRTLGELKKHMPFAIRDPMSPHRDWIKCSKRAIYHE